MAFLEDIRRARETLAGVAHHTPLLASRTFSEMAGRQVYLKAENLQRTGSFKVRGAFNRIAAIPLEDRPRGVVAASAGNHAQGVAVAARRLAIPCTIVMPRGASLAKIEATKGYGARVLQAGEDFGQAMEEARRLSQADGSLLIPAFDDPAVIAGQGTIALEILDDLPDVDVVAVPVGGGGLIGGVALGLKELRPAVRVVGVQAKAAQGVLQAFQSGVAVRQTPQATLADGIAIPQVGIHTFPLLQRYVDDVVAVSEEEIAHAMVLLLERVKLLVEGAGAVPLAALLAGSLPARGERVVLLLSGGNVDLTLLSHVLNHGLAHAGRYMVLQIVLLDRPGQLARLLDCLAEAQVNVLDVLHRRTLLGLHPGQVEVEVMMETRGPDHHQEVAAHLLARGYAPRGDTPFVGPGLLSLTARETAGREG